MSQDLTTPALPEQPCAAVPGRVRRCAIYARVSVSSSDDTQLNSLQAQVQACEAYIQAQRGMGWELTAPAYVDDGYSGGNLDRPALHQLLSDMQSGKFDVVAVQRLDRLCRSVRDICDLLPLFTIQGISLVSISQALDSETPMGRLPLHLLTSFGQFERELAGDRTREKIAATRANGKWQRNGIPLGYFLDEKQELQIDANEAAVVRDIFQRLLTSTSVPGLIEDLNGLGYRTKSHVSANGNLHGGQPFDRNTLNQLLRNRVCVGEVFYQDAWHPGKHEPLIDRQLWDQVQAIRSQRARRTGVPTAIQRAEKFPLGDRLFWHDGRAYTMYESSLRKGQRYRYYKAPATAANKDAGSGPMTLATTELHETVIDHLRQCFKDPQPWLQALSGEWANKPEFQESHVRQSLLSLDLSWHRFRDPLAIELILLLVDRVIFYPHQIEIKLNVSGLSELLQDFSAETIHAPKRKRSTSQGRKTPP